MSVNVPIPPDGSRVRVVLEGVSRDSTGRIFWIGGARRNCIFPRAEHVVSVEILEPEWQPGDVVLDAHGDCYERTHDAWRRLIDYQYRTCLVDPLTPIIRNGKPVVGGAS